MKPLGKEQIIKAAIIPDRRSVEVLHMDDGITVQVFHMDGGHTLELMHVDGDEHSEVIHIDGSTSIELISENEPIRAPVVTTFSPASFAREKETYVLQYDYNISKVRNTIATQTDLCNSCGPSMNLLFCTFFSDGNVQTQCDMPTQCHASVSTIMNASCKIQHKHRINYTHMENKGSSSLKTEEKESFDAERACVRFSRSGRILKGKGPLFMLDPSLVDGDMDCDPDFKPLRNEIGKENAGHQNSFYRKKSSRKRKRHLPSANDYDKKLKLANSDENGGMKEEIIIKDEPRDAGDELANEITNWQSEKFRGMHCTDEKCVKKLEEGTTKLTCRKCKKNFPSFSKFQQHSKEKHNSTEFTFPCNLCGVLFTRPHNLERHKGTKHDSKKQFVCEHCGHTFGRLDVLLVHISMVHVKKNLQDKNGPSDVKPDMLHCTSCDKFFSKQHKLRQHTQGNLTCSDCSASFNCKTSLRIHKYNQHPIECDECGKVCDSKHKLYFHRVSHAPKYVCKFCNKGFLRKSEYTVHISTHTGEKPIICDICGKSFAHKLAVGKHKRQSHNESHKKLKCEICNKSFAYKGKLEMHMRTHTGEKPFLCHHCPSTFSQQCNLTAHIKSVHGVYIHSLKSDGTQQTKLVKYKRVKRKGEMELPLTVVHTEKTPKVVSRIPRRCEVIVEEQVHVSESSEIEAAVHQIVNSQ